MMRNEENLEEIKAEGEELQQLRTETTVSH